MAVLFWCWIVRIEVLFVLAGVTGLVLSLGVWFCIWAFLANLANLTNPVAFCLEWVLGEGLLLLVLFFVLCCGVWCGGWLW